MIRVLSLGKGVLVDEHRIRALKDGEGRTRSRDHPPGRRMIVGVTANCGSPWLREGVEDDLQVLGFQGAEGILGDEGGLDIAEA
jgi:hypothetical protein